VLATVSARTPSWPPGGVRIPHAKCGSGALKTVAVHKEQRTDTRTHIRNKAVIDRRLCPQCCHLESYFKRPKNSPVRPLAGNWLSTKPEVSLHNVSLRHQRKTEPRLYPTELHKKGEDRTCSSEYMITDKHTHTHTQTDTLITILRSPIWRRSN